MDRRVLAALPKTGPSIPRSSRGRSPPRSTSARARSARQFFASLSAEFVKPIVADPQILSTDRAIAILEQLLTTVLPQLKESEEFNRLAKTVLGEEIEQRRNLRARRLEDTAT